MTEHITPVDFPARLAGLRDRLTGHAFLPGEDGYAEETSTYNLMTPLRPRVAVRAASVADVQAAVRFAAENDLGVAVRGGGHIVAKQDPDILVVSLRQMRAVSVVPDRRRVTFEGGALWQDVLDAVTPYGLAPLNGSSPTVGATGYLLAGGHSPLLGRSFGWAAEYITRIEVVTADGRARTVTADSDPDLFFALRGTKGNFGIVTAVEMEVFPVARLYGGGLWFAGQHMADVLDAWRTWVAGIPLEMATSIAVQRLPLDPQLPGPLRGAFVLHLRTAYHGPAEDGEKLLAPMRAAAPAILDTVAELPYAQAATIHMDPPAPLPYVDRSSGLAELTRDTVDALVRFAGPQSDCRLASIEIRHLGGALDREPRTPDAVPVRGLPFQLFAFGVGPEEEMPALRASLAGLIEAVRPWAHPRRMLAFLSPDEATGPRTVRELYGAERYDRLARIKRQYDPANMFRVNHNIEPAGPGEQ
jgi:FAD/FMN-containing dehydrogenase